MMERFSQEIARMNRVETSAAEAGHPLDEPAVEAMRKPGTMLGGQMDRSTRAHVVTGSRASKAAFVIVLFAIAASPGLISAKLHAAAPGKASGPATAAPASGPQVDSQTPAGATLTLNVPTAPVDAGASFQVPVTLTGATDVVSFTIIFDYDSTPLRLASISPGDFLNRDGEPARIVHSDSPMGHVVISMSLPPGSQGVNGDGTVCVLNFSAVDPGASDLKITRAWVVDRTNKMIPAHFVQPHIVVK